MNIALYRHVSLVPSAGSLPASSFKARMATEVTDVGHTSDGEARCPSSKSVVCVYNQSAPPSHKVVHYVHNPDAGERAINGSGASAPLSVDGGEEEDEGHRLLCPRDSSHPAGSQDSKHPGPMELVPLEELTTTLPATKGASRKLSGRKKLSDNRYN